MKLGTETGSVINHLQSRAVIGQPEPEAGMGVTMLAWTDRYAGTITSVEPIVSKGAVSGVLVHATRDNAKVVAGTTQDGSAAYEYSPRPNGSVFTFRRQADGSWVQVERKVFERDAEGQPSKVSPRWSKLSGGGLGLRIGERDEYRDPTY